MTDEELKESEIWVPLSVYQDRVEDIEKSGHTYHCACRQVWGDGECDCMGEGNRRREDVKP